MKIFKVRTVKTPTRGTDYSAGIDFYVPEFNQQFKSDVRLKNLDAIIDDNNSIINISPHSRILIPSGIHVKVPYDYALIAFNKSGVATKKGLDIAASVVDSDYEGEIHLSLTNTTGDVVTISENEKIVQFLLIPISMDGIIEVNSKEELYPVKSTRGEGAFGSTNHI